MHLPARGARPRCGCRRGRQRRTTILIRFSWGFLTPRCVREPHQAPAGEDRGGEVQAQAEDVLGRIDAQQLRKSEGRVANDEEEPRRIGWPRLRAAEKRRAPGSEDRQEGQVEGGASA
jgi:hypothetical protein